MNESLLHRLSDLLPAASRGNRRLAVSATLNIAWIGAALFVGAGLLAGMMPRDVGHLYAFKVLGCYLLLLLPLLAGLHAHLPHGRFGAANTVTLLRAGLICLLAPLYGGSGRSDEFVIATLAVIALSLDGVDGWLARRHDTQSRFGARFDMETDALLVLVLSLLAWQSGMAGAWVLAAGLMRYAFLGATMLWRWLDRPLPESPRRKTICVLQLIALIACVAPVLPDLWRLAAAVYAVLMVSASFGADIFWLARRRRLPMPDLPPATGALDAAG